MNGSKFKYIARRNNMKEKNEGDKKILLSEGWSNPRRPTQI